MDINARSLSLSWEPPPPDSLNGIIRKYIINLTDLYTGESAIHKSYNTSVKLCGLHPFTVYQVSVSAFTISAGPYTEILEAVTEEDGEFGILHCTFSVHSSKQFLQLHQRT